MKKIIYILTISLFVNSQVYAGGDNIMNAASGAITGVMMLTTAANMNQGKEFTAKCSGQAWMYCAMAVLAFAQAAMSLKGAGESNAAKSATECTGQYCSGGGVDPFNPGGTNNPGGNFPGGDPIAGGTLPPGGDPGDVLGRIQDDINNQLGNLKDKGYSYDAANNAVNTPNNGSVAASSFGSADGMKALGMTDEQIKTAQQIAKDALKNASKYALDLDGGGGGGKIKPGPGYDKDGKGFDMNKYLAGLMKNGEGRGVAGLEKKYGSDQIGVAQDDIFKMVHRRYEAKQSTLHP